jgi:hypothetical protein
MTVGIVDNELTSDGIVLPGMGDCGDRLFGTGNQQADFIHDNGNGNSGGISGDDGTGTASAGGASGGEDSNEEGNNNHNNSTNNSTNFETKRKRSASLELEMENK